MKALTITCLSLSLIACKTEHPDNPDQDIVISGSASAPLAPSKTELSQAQSHVGPSIVISDDVVDEDIQPHVPVPQPVPQPTGPTKQAIANCKGYSPYDAKVLADGTVDLVYSWTVTGIVYPLVTNAVTHDGKMLRGIDFGNGRVDYIEDGCLM